LQGETGRAPAVQYLRIGLVPADRRGLYARLDRRLADMVREGLVEEVRQLRALPLMSADSPAMRAVGYRQIWQHLSGEFDLPQAQRQAAVATHRLAKRQLTWLRSEPVDMALDTAASDVFGAVTRAMDEAGVSRRGQRCNMMDPPLECREHGL
jgi:tRNA dimethylallyltransferase